MTATELVKWMLVGFLAISALGTPSRIGVERKPITPVEAGVMVTLDVALIVAIVIWW